MRNKRATEKLKASYGPTIVQASQILEKNIVPPTGAILAFSEAEWKKAISKIEISKEPPPRDAMRLIGFRLPPELASIGSYGVVPFCFSSPLEKCVAVSGPGPRDEPNWWYCHCEPVGTGDEEEEDEGPTVEDLPYRIKCSLVYKNGLLRCQGPCDEGACVARRTATDPIQIWCACLLLETREALPPDR